MYISRYLQGHIIKDLQKKMVFIGGPRQCGKTTLAIHLLKTFPYPSGHQGLYLNWDDDDHRRRILKREWTEEDDVVVFDELHKFHRWKNWLKGIYDTTKDIHKYMVTGSARLDVYRRGGDSLLGRYHYWRLHPFTLSEPIPGIDQKEYLKRLMSIGGFPEPFMDNNERESKRWRRERLDRVLKDDIRDLEQIHNIQALGLFLDALRQRVGSTIVLSNIAEDLQISHRTLKRWITILENMYVIFSVRPYTKNISRAIHKPLKIYFFDNADVKDDESARFENVVATHLLKKIHFMEDATGERYELNYIRDKEKREIDFVLVQNGEPQILIEVKLSETTISKSLEYYADRLKPKRALQIVRHLRRSYGKGKLYVQGPFEDLAIPL